MLELLIQCENLERNENFVYSVRRIESLDNNVKMMLKWNENKTFLPTLLMQKIFIK